eukprot:TRINITY_DN6253_c0_g1_i2.p2 TRINITY_DN6253_c0_g1~~TRINITY_DN6253_c0_g1_i2.p2  ORF type:complete len:196 (+),score=32.91 TRINITY_DN6253_c0_g1_i2:1200-1787(+)
MAKSRSLTKEMRELTKKFRETQPNLIKTAPDPTPLHEIFPPKSMYKDDEFLPIRAYFPLDGRWFECDGGKTFPMGDLKSRLLVYRSVYGSQKNFDEWIKVHEFVGEGASPQQSIQMLVNALEKKGVTLKIEGNQILRVHETMEEKSYRMAYQIIDVENAHVLTIEVIILKNLHDSRPEELEALRIKWLKAFDIDL